MHRSFAVLISVLLVAGCTAALSESPSNSPVSASPQPTQVPTASPPAADLSPLAEALQFVPPNIFTVEFTDWAGLKEQKGFADLTGAATQLERDTFRETLLSAAVVGEPRNELEYISSATYHPIRRTLLEQWGFDAFDLRWEANLTGVGEPAVFVRILRMRDSFDLTTLRTRFEERGYAKETHGETTIWTHGIAQDPWLLIDGQLGMATVAVLESAHVMMLGGLDVERGRDGLVAVLDAMADPTVAASVRDPLDAAARQLDHPVGAYLAVGAQLCTQLDPANNPQFPAVAVAEIQAAGPLHLYAAFALGYSRAHEPIGRFVFTYASAADAESDLAGRESLARTGTLLGDQSGRSYAEIFTVESASVDALLLTIEVTPQDDLPQRLFQLPTVRSLSFAACAT